MQRSLVAWLRPLLLVAIALPALTSCDDTVGKLSFYEADLWMNKNPDFAIRCPGVFPQFNKSCFTPLNCAVVKHVKDCCGNTVVTAVNAQEEGKYQSFEDVCRGMLKSQPSCSCDGGTNALVDDTGKPLGGSQMVQVACESGLCVTHSL